MIWLSEKRRLIVFISILLLSGFFLTSIIGYQVSKTTLKDIIFQSELPLTGDNIYSEIQRDLLPPISIASMMANDTFLRDWVIKGERDQKQVSKYLDEIKTKYGTISTFFVSEQSRAYYHPGGILKFVSPDSQEDEWYFRVRELVQDFEINIDTDKVSQHSMTIFINHKVTGFDGRYIGATGVGLGVDTVQKLINSYSQKYKRHIFLIDRNGDVVLTRAGEEKGPLNISDMPGIGALAKQILLTTAGSFEYQRDGETYLLAARYVPELKWILLVEQSESQAVGALKRTLVINLLISLIVTVVVLIATFFAIDMYQKRLDVMADEEKFINDQLTQLNEQKGKMLSIIGHDLRSPFNAILGFAELLRSKAGDLRRDEIAEYAENVAQSSRNANVLLDSLLGWATFQWGNFTPNATRIGVDSLVNRNIEMFGPNAEVKNITLRKRGAQNVQVIADENMADMVLRNLINNALKFTSSGGTVTVNVKENADMAWISVTDSGVGIDKDKLDTLFEKQDEKSTKGTNGEAGLGMGLTLSRDMVAVNGGSILVESEPGNGTTFLFSLPLA
jgi:signal transduction histidine kinase